MIGIDWTQVPEWPEALCKGPNSALFFRPDDEVKGSKAQLLRVRSAKMSCEQCVHKDDCLDYALANNETYGIWGGKSESERRTLRRAKGVMRDRRLKPIAHGTNNGYTMHRRRHELPCDGCRSAHSEYLALTVKARQR